MSLVEVVVSMVLLAVAALAVSSTLGLVSGPKMRSTSGSLDLQAASYARQTIEELKNAVSPQTGAGETGAPLVDTSYGTPCPLAVVAGSPCGGAGGGTNYAYNPVGPVNGWLAIPAGDLATASGARSYKVWDISGGGGTVAYKKVTVTLTWTDPS